ncbi:MAG: lipid-A-disaccharide synthase [Desulfobacterales bacterium]|nr:lipid-A-disaccharide synthase [Desulfobacterales bacterium]
MILTGEPSGDFHAAPLIRELIRSNPGIRISGIGGPAMAGEGAQLFFPIEKLSAMGLVQVIRQFGTIKKAFRTVQHQVKTDKPDVIVLIDYPGFNLKVARYIKENFDIPICYYIAPKVWAWNSARLNTIKKYIDHVALILPFELSIYKRRKITATYVGNPLLDEYPAAISDKKLFNDHDSIKKAPVIGLLPGSRSAEIEKLLPVMLDSALAIKDRHLKASFLVSSGSDLYKNRIEQIVSSHPCNKFCKIVQDRPLSIFKKADLLIAASGTVTLEAALCGVPTILIYKMSPIAFKLATLLVKVKFAGLANLIAGQEVMPELLQTEANPLKISQTVFSMLPNLKQHRIRLNQVRKKLGSSGAPKRTAQIVLNLIRRT